MIMTQQPAWQYLSDNDGDLEEWIDPATGEVVTVSRAAAGLPQLHTVPASGIDRVPTAGPPEKKGQSE